MVRRHRSLRAWTGCAGLGSAAATRLERALTRGDPVSDEPQHEQSETREAVPDEPQHEQGETPETDQEKVRSRSLRSLIGRRDLPYLLIAVPLWGAVLLDKHSTRERALGVALVAVLVTVTVTDLRHRIIPDRVTGPGAVLAIVIGLLSAPGQVPGQLIAGAGAFLALLVFAVISRGGIKGGDVKLAGVIGVYLSRSVIVALSAGILAGGVYSLGIVAVSSVRGGRAGARRGLRTWIPYGPFLALGGLIGLFAGPHFLHS